MWQSAATFSHSENHSSSSLLMMFFKTLCTLLLLFSFAGLFEAFGACVPQLKASSTPFGLLCSLSFVQLYWCQLNAFLVISTTHPLEKTCWLKGDFGKCFITTGVFSSLLYIFAFLDHFLLLFALFAGMGWEISPFLVDPHRGHSPPPSPGMFQLLCAVAHHYFRIFWSFFAYFYLFCRN